MWTALAIINLTGTERACFTFYSQGTLCLKAIWADQLPFEQTDGDIPIFCGIPSNHVASTN
jgi:hypothetical protein